jgi:exonuclease SbcC
MIESNEIIKSNIESIKSKIKIVDSNIKQKNTDIINLKTRLNSSLDQKNNIEKTIEEAKTLESKYEAYELYNSSVGRDGIPYELISQALPTIEKEVNNILSQIVEFTVSLQTDGKNVSTFINYEDKKWPLELSSGMEKFVSSLAIRVALINISNLPRPNFIAIDEGFGCADADNLSSMSTLFAFLKTNFDFVWVISHLDQMRDMVDNRIEIRKENGFSKVSFI